MGRMASDGSEGSEGKEGGNDGLGMEYLMQSTMILNNRRKFMGNNSSSDGSESSEAKEASEKSGFIFNDFASQKIEEIKSCNQQQSKKHSNHKLGLLIF